MKKNMYKEPVNPLENIDVDIYQKLTEYPFSFDEIIDVVLRSQNKINKLLNPKYTPDWWAIIPMKEGTEFGGLYENAIRYRFNKFGVLTFGEGNHNSGKDLDHPVFGTEIKTKQNLQFNNTNDRGRTHESTKYNDTDNSDDYYILIQQIANTKYIPFTTTVKRIFFGRLSKRDFTNPNGTGAAYLLSDVRNKKCVEIWNDQVGNTIEHYQGYLDNCYHERLIELENDII